MLQNEPQEESQNVPFIPAAQRRVTADELNAALSALESRKQEEAKHGRETVEIGAVVQELGIDLTPDEIWQQVEAQRAKNAPPPPPAAPKLAESNLADTVNETLHVMAQEAKKVAIQASAAAQEAIAHAQAHQAQQAAAQARNAAKQARKAARVRPQRRHGGGFWPLLIAAGCIGYAVFSANNGLMIGSDHATVTYAGNRGTAVILGDHNTITLSGNCGTLTVLGDHDTITVTGTVKRIISPGDHNTIEWAQTADGQSPSVTDIGDGNSIHPGAEIDPLPPMLSPPAPGQH